MTPIHKTPHAVCLVFFGLLFAGGAVSLAQEEDFNQEQFDLIAGFVGDPDRETRALGLQFIREAMPGEEAN